ncbi:MAG: indole-3-glycerol-phosphate synthase [Gammaproteobacteria bacterium]|nr:indole-3-glycerol-phosphate synthase [Gammaproteobacteria bacterium]MDH5276074.1 indole-3-glycerol-phosphate synthase [Gammaproteobacteria bacterium]
MNSESPNFLARMAARSRVRAEAAERRRPAEPLARRVRGLPLPPALRLSPQGFDIIAEVKRRSPSAGTLASSALKIASQARNYVRGGAAALSVLTEPAEFAGDLGHLKEAAAAAAPVPAMRKDFLVSPYQLLEARTAGAGGVLLIAAMLGDHELREMLRAARQLGLFALVEVFDLPDLRRAAAHIAAAGPAVEDGRCCTLLGVNCRDLRTLEVDFGRFAALAPHLPHGVPCVAESGVESAGQAARVAGLGYDVALVGSALMRAPDPGNLVRDLLAAGRASASESRRR